MISWAYSGRGGCTCIWIRICAYVYLYLYRHLHLVLSPVALSRQSRSNPTTEAFSVALLLGWPLPVYLCYRPGCLVLHFGVILSASPLHLSFYPAPYNRLQSRVLPACPSSHEEKISNLLRFHREGIRGLRDKRSMIIYSAMNEFEKHLNLK